MSNSITLHVIPCDMNLNLQAISCKYTLQMSNIIVMLKTVTTQSLISLLVFWSTEINFRYIFHKNFSLLRIIICHCRVVATLLFQNEWLSFVILKWQSSLPMKLNFHRQQLHHIRRMRICIGPHHFVKVSKNLTGNFALVGSC